MSVLRILVLPPKPKAFPAQEERPKRRSSKDRKNRRGRRLSIQGALVGCGLATGGQRDHIHIRINICSGIPLYIGP